jgi:hypothetical protein
LSNGTTRNRGIWYNHSTFIDLIIAALIGLRTTATSAVLARAAASGEDEMDSITVFPLADGLTYFALDNLRVRGHSLTIAYDPTGTRYAAKSGGLKGLGVWVDGELVASAPGLAELHVKLN